MFLDATIYRDRFAAVGEYPINLLAELIPNSYGVVDVIPNPDVVEIISGNEAGHFTLSGTTLDFSTSGDAADMPNGTYTINVRGTWNARAPYDKWTAKLTIICHTRTRYVDHATGLDTNDGLTKATCWANPPGHPLATDISAAYTPSSSERTLISIKGGNIYRGQTFMKANCTFATVGWGTGKSEFTTYTSMGSGVAATQSEVFNNPNLANIKKFVGTTAASQPIRDGTALSFPAQYPAWGADQYIDGQVPNVEGRGMRRLPYSAPVVYEAVTGPTTTRTRYIYHTTWPELVTVYPGINFNGTTCYYWGGANHVMATTVINHNPATGYFEFDVTSAIPASYNIIAVNFTGHPAFINGPSQHAWDSNNTYCWLGESSAPEKATNYAAINIVNKSNCHFYQLKLSGGYTDEAQFNGGCILAASGGDIAGLNVIACDFSHMYSGSDQAAAVRTAGVGALQDVLCERNTVTKFYRSSGFRFSNVGKRDIVVRRNYVDRCGRTSVYLINSHNCIVEDNIFNNCQSAHGNVITFYMGGDETTATATAGSPILTDVLESAFTLKASTGVWSTNMDDQPVVVYGAGASGGKLYGKVIAFDGPNRTLTLDVPAVTSAAAVKVSENLDIGAVIRYNTAINCTRPFTTHGVIDMQIYGNVFEMDGDTTAGAQNWSNVDNILIYRNMFMRRRNDKGNGEDAVAIRGSGRAHHNVFDGLSNMAAGEIIECDFNLVTAITGNDARIFDNVAPHHDNYLSAVYTTNNVWNGTIPTEFKKAVGYGRIGATGVVYVLAEANFASVVDVKTGTLTTSAWTPLITESVSVPISVSSGLEYSIADNSSGLNATVFTSSPGTILKDKYIQLRRTSSTFNFDTLIGTVTFGEGLSNTWAVTTKRASGFTVARMTTATRIVQAVAMAQGTDSPTGVVYLPAFMPHTAFSASAAVTIIGAIAATAAFVVEILNTGRLRFRLRNSDNVTIAQFSTPTSPVLALDVPHDYLVQWDFTQPDDASAIKMYIDGSEVTPSSITYATSATVANRNVAWSYTDARWRMGYDGDIEYGAILVHNSLPSDGGITNASVRSKFSAVRIAPDDGASIFDGVKPRFFCVGTAATWNSANGTVIVNRGSGPQVTKETGSVTAGASSALSWPSFTYATTPIITGPPKSQVGVAADYTVTFNGALANDAVLSFSDGGKGGTFSTLTVNWGETPTGTFTYTPGAYVGPATLTASASGLTSGTINIDIVPPDATSYTVDIPNNGSVNTPVNVVVNLNGYNPSPVSFVFSATSSAGTFLPSSTLIIEPGEYSGSVAFIPINTGSFNIGYETSSLLTGAGSQTIEITPEVKTITAGSTITLTVAQAKTLASITSNNSIASGLGPVALRWNILTSNAGAPAGLDVKMNVVPNDIESKTVDLPSTGITGIVGSELTSVPDDNYVYVTLDSSSPTVAYDGDTP